MLVFAPILISSRTRVCIPPLCVQYNRESLNSRLFASWTVSVWEESYSSAFSTFPWTEPRNKISQRRGIVSFYHALYYYIRIFSERIPNDSSIFQVFKNTDKIFNQLFSFRILILSLWNFSISFITSISFSSRSRFNPFFKNCSSSNCEK